MILRHCSSDEFLQYSKQKELFCFGAGKFFLKFLSECNVVERVKFIIDNDVKKIGTFLTVMSHSIKILSLEDALLQVDDNAVFIITAGGDFGVDIYNQLERYEPLRNTPLYWAWSILSCNVTKMGKYVYQPIQFRLTETRCIPKIIHYCWFGNKKIPKEYRNYIDGWKQLCPDYEIIEWNEMNYDITKNAFIQKAYEAKAWAFVSDYVRKDVIYEYGGVYFDTDVEMLRNIDELLFQKGFCAFENFQVASGLGFGAERGLEIIREWRDIYETLTFDNNTIANMIACPVIETSILKKYGFKENGRLQYVAGLTVYPTEVLSGTNRYTGESFTTPNTYTVHHYASSWVDETFRSKWTARKKLFCKALHHGEDNLK